MSVTDAEKAFYESVIADALDGRDLTATAGGEVATAQAD